MRCFRVYLRSDWMSPETPAAKLRASRARGGCLQVTFWKLLQFGAVELPLVRFNQDQSGAWSVELEPGSFLEEMLVSRCMP